MEGKKMNIKIISGVIAVVAIITSVVAWELFLHSKEEVVHTNEETNFQITNPSNLNTDYQELVSSYKSVYTNTELGFQITFPSNWNNHYQVFAKPPRKVSFLVPTAETGWINNEYDFPGYVFIFGVEATPLYVWDAVIDECRKGEEPELCEQYLIGKTSQYAITWFHAQDSPSDIAQYNFGGVEYLRAHFKALNSNISNQAIKPSTDKSIITWKVETLPGSDIKATIPPLPSGSVGIPSVIMSPAQRQTANTWYVTTNTNNIELLLKNNEKLYYSYELEDYCMYPSYAIELISGNNDSFEGFIDATYEDMAPIEKEYFRNGAYLTLNGKSIYRYEVLEDFPHQAAYIELENKIIKLQMSTKARCVNTDQDIFPDEFNEKSISAPTSTFNEILLGIVYNN